MLPEEKNEDAIHLIENEKLIFLQMREKLIT